MKAIFYTYLLRRDGIPFYIGKGCNGRVDAHEMCARTRTSCRHQTCRIIRKVWREGGEITTEKICEDVYEYSAFKMEKLMIAVGFASGWPLVNQTDGGEGVSGYRWTPEQREERRIRALQDTESVERLRKANTGRKRSPEEMERRLPFIQQIWTDPEKREKQKRRLSSNGKTLN